MGYSGQRCRRTSQQEGLSLRETQISWIADTVMFSTRQGGPAGRGKVQTLEQGTPGFKSCQGNSGCDSLLRVT